MITILTNPNSATITFLADNLDLLKSKGIEVHLLDSIFDSLEDVQVFVNLIESNDKVKLLLHCLKSPICHKYFYKEKVEMNFNVFTRVICATYEIANCILTLKEGGKQFLYHNFKKERDMSGVGIFYTIFSRLQFSMETVEFGRREKRLLVISFFEKLDCNNGGSFFDFLSENNFPLFNELLKTFENKGCLACILKGSYMVNGGSAYYGGDGRAHLNGNESDPLLRLLYAGSSHLSLRNNTRLFLDCIKVIEPEIEVLNIFVSRVFYLVAESFDCDKTLMEIASTTSLEKIVLFLDDGVLDGLIYLLIEIANEKSKITLFYGVFFLFATIIRSFWLFILAYPNDGDFNPFNKNKITYDA